MSRFVFLSLCQALLLGSALSTNEPLSKLIRRADQCTRSFSCQAPAFGECTTCGRAPTDKVYYTLALQKCTKTSPWTIHGLWPDYSNGFPCLCQGPTSYSTNEQSPIDARLRKNWADCKPEQCGQDYFWRFEWEKHGSCMLKVGAVSSQLEYFNLTVTLLENYQKDGSLDRICQGRTNTCNIKVRDNELSKGLTMVKQPTPSTTSTKSSAAPTTTKTSQPTSAPDPSQQQKGSQAVALTPATLSILLLAVLYATCFGKKPTTPDTGMTAAPSESTPLNENPSSVYTQ